MGICLAVQHQQNTQIHCHSLHCQQDIGPIGLKVVQTSIDFDFVALCFAEICLHSTSPVSDDMRVKTQKETSLKSQIYAKFSASGKRRLDEVEDCGGVASTLTKTETKMNKNTINSNNDQTTQTLNRKLSSIELCSPPKRTKNETMIISASELSAFFELFDDDVIQDFLWMDSCARVADKYLIAMVFTYFKRAKYLPRQYTRMNFFLALYLASDMEEDEEEYKYEIFPWALGKNWRNKYTGFLKKRDKLLRTIDYRAAVSRICCEEVMSLYPDHVVWQRERKEHHGGAVRQYDDSSEDCFIPIGPNGSPAHCDLCAKTGSFAYCLSSPCKSPNCDDCIYLSSCSDESTDSVMELGSDEVFEKGSNPPGRFDMNGLKSTLQTVPDDSYFWATRDE